MIVLQVNNVYGRLSTGKIVADLHHEYQKRGIESYVCYGRGLKIKEYNVYKTSWELYSKVNKLRGRMSGCLYGGCTLSTLKLISIIKKIKPDIVHLHCINDDFVNVYKMLNYLKKHRISTVVTLHAEFMYTGNCGHSYKCNKWKQGCGNCSQRDAIHTVFDNTHIAWKKMFKSFADFEYDSIIITSVSPWLKERAVQSPMLKSYRQFVVLNGVNTNVFYRHKFREEQERLGLLNKKIVLFVTSSFTAPSKGGNFIIELAKKMSDVNFVVLGEKGKPCDVPDNVKLLGRVYNQEKVATLYSMADVTIILSRAETFSMPTAESLCCGTPVVGFKAGGPETIGISEYCRFTEYGDLNKLQQVVIEILSINYDRQKISEQAQAKYSLRTMANGYARAYDILKNEIGKCSAKCQNITISKVK